MAVCFYHPERTAIGICMRCRRVICADCSTKMDGINYCHACLGALGRRPTSEAAGTSRIGTLMLCGLAWLVMFGLLWLAQGRLAP